MNNLYFFEGMQQTLIKEKFEQRYTEKLQIYVWRSEDNSLGFDSNDKGALFVRRLLNKYITITFPQINAIDNSELNKKSVFNLRGISFIDSHGLIRKEYDEYLSYQQEVSRNTLLERYNKATKELVIPNLAGWFDKERRLYTKKFDEFINCNKIEFLVWAFSDFGIYFFTFHDIFPEVKKVAEALSVQTIMVKNLMQMPYH